LSLVSVAVTFTRTESATAMATVLRSASEIETATAARSPELAV